MLIAWQKKVSLDNHSETTKKYVYMFLINKIRHNVKIGSGVFFF